VRGNLVRQPLVDNIAPAELEDAMVGDEKFVHARPAFVEADMVAFVGGEGQIGNVQVEERGNEGVGFVRGRSDVEK